MLIPKIDQKIGIEVYVASTLGIGGVIRRNIDDFVVEEVLVDASKAKIDAAEGKPPLGATDVKQRFLLCILVKRNWDTLIAVKKVAKELGIEPSRIQIAGIKDAKAVTSQYLTIDGVSIEDALKVQFKDLKLLPVGYFHQPLSAYFLLGNCFTIHIRNISHSKATVENRINTTMAEIENIGGIPNFYGHQRFGTTRSITHLVGKALVQGNLKKAAMIFLANPSSNEHPLSRQARADLQSSQNFKQALQRFPLQLRYERIMLSHLVEHQDDFLGAFRRLPLKLRMLFVQAYQSFLFNRFLSARIKSGFSLSEAEVGDYVVNVERSGLPMVRTGRIVDSASLRSINDLINSGKMRVALPILGFKQKLSEGVSGELQLNILEEEGVELQNFKVDVLPEVNSKGELRAIISPVKFSSYKVSADMVAEKRKQVSLEFMLPRGSYATVLLREIMKTRNPIKAGF
ncbi:MAG: tRNA pseudouridine(13) synthase TruD [Candidatus Bathyarchaeota archaeon]|nr:tRNA pseudouridine(13) synthase TruD [Candidatus Bathyarchaeota archaeon]